MRYLVGGVAVIGAAAAALLGAGVASADDFQISIDGLDLFPTTGNTATAESTFGNMAIASGVGANANATDGFGNTADASGTKADALAGITSSSFFNSAWASGDNTLAEAGGGSVDTAVATGTGSEAVAGNGSFDTAIASAGKLAEATGSNGLFTVEPAAADPAAAPAADVGPLQLLFGDSGINSWTPDVDALLGNPTSLDSLVDSFETDGNAMPFQNILTEWLLDYSAYSDQGGSYLPDTTLGDLATTLDFSLYASGLAPVVDPAILNTWQIGEDVLLSPLLLLAGFFA
jgi:hypothetical protein